MKLTVVPLTLADAGAAVDRWHRHHRRPQGHRFSLGVLDGADRLRGVAIVGRPVARVLDTGWTVEVTRVATDGCPNACSALYGGVWQTARAMGFRRALTYTQDGESGASLRAAGWRRAAELRPRTGWDTPSRRRTGRGTDGIARTLWEQTRAGALPLPPIGVLRDELRDEIQCAACGRSVPLPPGPGRPPRYCTVACRKRAYRHRHTQRAAEVAA
ncbi:XF1762 family protein [Streptomyces avicenniae]|uniref:XF1762 family protein n=1 Tax=Streptomyces avicenniae TaxID=500153 RepID=UPI000A685697|nr:XF1762 family protein [Streptomyces avicenniae]